MSMDVRLGWTKGNHVDVNLMDDLKGLGYGAPLSPSIQWGAEGKKGTHTCEPPCSTTGLRHVIYSTVFSIQKRSFGNHNIFK